MAKAKPVKGKDLMLFVDGKAIALAKTCTLNLSQEMLDASSKDDGEWEANDIVDGKSYDLSADAVYSADEAVTTAETYDALFDKFVAGEPVPFTCGIAQNAAVEYPEGGWTAPTTKGYQGKMMINSLSLNGNKGEAASFSVGARGVGPMSKLAAG